MALIAMAVYDTDENGRTDYTARTLKSILDTVNLDRHRVVIVDNASCADTKRILDLFSGYHGFSGHHIARKRRNGQGGEQGLATAQGWGELHQDG
jgi:hypothetical protein